MYPSKIFFEQFTHFLSLATVYPSPTTRQFSNTNYSKVETDASEMRTESGVESNKTSSACPNLWLDRGIHSFSEEDKIIIKK